MAPRMPDAVYVVTINGCRFVSRVVSILTTAVSITGIRPCSRACPMAVTVGLRCPSICITACRMAASCGLMRSRASISVRHS